MPRHSRDGCHIPAWGALIAFKRLHVTRCAVSNVGSGPFVLRSGCTHSERAGHLLGPVMLFPYPKTAWKENASGAKETTADLLALVDEMWQYFAGMPLGIESLCYSLSCQKLVARQ
eukprot:3697092-Amphidinium_carterae.1